MDLLSMGIYSLGTVKPSSIGLPSNLTYTKSFKNVLQGHTLWRMHASKKVSCVMWKDKKPLLLISTHALHIQSHAFYLESALDLFVYFFL